MTDPQLLLTSQAARDAAKPMAPRVGESILLRNSHRLYKISERAHNHFMKYPHVNLIAALSHDGIRVIRTADFEEHICRPDATLAGDCNVCGASITQQNTQTRKEVMPDDAGSAGIQSTRPDTSPAVDTGGGAQDMVMVSRDLLLKWATVWAITVSTIKTPGATYFLDVDKKCIAAMRQKAGE